MHQLHVRIGTNRDQHRIGRNRGPGPKQHALHDTIASSNGFNIGADNDLSSVLGVESVNLAGNRIRNDARQEGRRLLNDRGVNPSSVLADAATSSPIKTASDDR